MNKNELKTIADVAFNRCQKFAKRTKKYYFDSEDLACMCASASLVLGDVFNRLDISNDMVESPYEIEGHVWLIVEGYHVDVTATQYGQEGTYVGKKFYNKGFNVGRRTLPKQTSKRYYDLLETGWKDENQLIPLRQVRKMAIDIIYDFRVIQLSNCWPIIQQTIDEAPSYNKFVNAVVRGTMKYNLMIDDNNFKR